MQTTSLRNGFLLQSQFLWKTKQYTIHKAAKSFVTTVGNVAKNYINRQTAQRCPATGTFFETPPETMVTPAETPPPAACRPPLAACR